MVRLGGNRYLDIAAAMKNAARLLRELDAADSQADSVAALLETRDTVVDDVVKAEARYQAAGDALVEYAAVLDSAQVSARNAATSATYAEERRWDAEKLVNRYRRDRARALDAVNFEEAARLRRLIQLKQTEADEEATSIAQHRTVVESAIQDRDQAAQRTMDQIQAITANDE
ncbi:MAG: hypothetical protein LBO75_00590, partial [Bifidobacteriaceae bacterium]|nr:hypothetical protein [Bifidobacteriaceae bacterium]